MPFPSGGASPDRSGSIIRQVHLAYKRIINLNVLVARSLLVLPALMHHDLVAAVIRDANDCALVYETLDKAMTDNPDAHPLFHSDRGFQYTTQVFHDKLAAAGMTQSMSRVGKCIDNGPMEGFWGILKRERYYGRRFTSREELVWMIEDYIAYYNSRRLQRGLGVLTPFEKHELAMAA